MTQSRSLNSIDKTFPRHVHKYSKGESNTCQQVYQGNSDNVSALIPCLVNGVHVNASDTGSEVTVLNFDTQNKLVHKSTLKEKVKLNGIYRDTDIDGWLIYLFFVLCHIQQPESYFEG